MYWNAFYDASILNQKKKGTCKNSWIDKNIIIMKNTPFILIIIHQLCNILQYASCTMNHYRKVFEV